MGNDLLDQVMGCMFGLAVGDALGLTVERMSPDEIWKQYGLHKEIIGGGWLSVEPGEVSDDTDMALCLANSLIACSGYDIFDAARKYVEWMESGPVDMGVTTRTALKAIKQGVSPVSSGVPAPSAANGSAMRCAPIGIVYWKDSKKRTHYSREDSSITHANSLCLSACVLVNELIAQLLAGASLSEAQQKAAALPIDGRLISCLYQKSHMFRPSGYIIDTLQAASYGLFTRTSFEDTLIAVVNQGGDADTTCAIAGAVAGAHYGFKGIPKRWIDKLLIKKELERVSKGLFDLAKR